MGRKMIMAEFEIPTSPEFSAHIRKFETTDPAHADLFNAVTQSLINNDVFLNIVAEQLQQAITQHMSDKDNPHGSTKKQVGLGNADNTSDMDKPVSTAQQNAIDAAYQQSTGYTDKKIADLIGGAPMTLDTLGEIADAMADNADVVAALDIAIGKKANEAEMESLLNTKLDKTGDASNVTTAFSQATTRTNLSSKEKLSVSMGKIMKWFADLANGAASTLLGGNLSANRALVSNGSGKVAQSGVTSTELGYLAGAKSKIQTQLDGKLDKSGGTISGGNLHIHGGNVAPSPYGLILSRMGSTTNQYTYLYTDDNGLVIDSKQDEANCRIKFNLIYTDTENSSETGVEQKSEVVFNASKGLSYIHADNFVEGNVALVNKYLGKTEMAAGAKKIELLRVEKGDANNLGNGFSGYITEIRGDNDSKNTPPVGTSANNTWFHIITCKGADGRYTTQLALGMTVDGVWYRRCDADTWGSWIRLDIGSTNVKKQLITWATSGVYVPDENQQNCYYVVKNGWCFFQIVFKLETANTQYHLNVYLPKPFSQSNAYWRVSTECEVRISSNGQMRLSATKADTDYVVNGSYPVL